MLEGNVGVGTGATVGKILGPRRAMKSGLGSASVWLNNNLVVGALVAVNAIGDVVHPQTGEILAGARRPQSDAMANTLEVMKNHLSGTGRPGFSNTVIGVVATNAKLTQAEATKVAQMAQDGLARAIRPAHTMLDGDTIFALATGEKKANPTTVGAFAAEVMAEAILRGAQKAAPAGGLPGLNQV